MSNPYSSGGGGTVLEHRYGAVLLTHVLTSEAARELGDDAVPTHLVFQAKHLSPVDDFVLLGHDDNGEVGAAIAVRRSPDLIPSDRKSRALIESFLQALLHRWLDIDAGRWHLFLATGSACQAAQQLRKISQFARWQPSEAEFRAAMKRPQVDGRELRNRLKQLDAIVQQVSAGLNAGMDDSELTWRLLRRLKVRELHLEDGDESDRTNAVNRLISHTSQRSQEAASSLFSRLAELAGTFAPTGATVDAAMLRTELAGSLARITTLGTAPPAEVTADIGAVLRGPLAYLGLDALFDEAQQQMPDDPAEAAKAFAAVADRLESTPYTQYAYGVRRRQAEALQQAGDVASRIRADLHGMVIALESGDAWRASRLINELAAQEVEGDDALIRSANALGVISEFENDHRTTLQQVASAVDELNADDSYGLEAATLFAEHTIAENETLLVRDRGGALQAIADAAPTASLWQARLRACLADAGYQATTWPALASQARFQPDPIPSFLSARYARHLARSGQPDEAISQYTTAIDHALRHAGPALQKDAADWLEAQNLIRIRYGIQREQITDSHLMPATLRASGTGTLLPNPVSTREHALARLARDSNPLPDTLQALRRYRLKAVITGAWQREEEAERLLGEFHLRAGQARKALPHLVAAAQTKTLKSIVDQLPYEPLPSLGADQVGGRQQWERASAFTLAGAAADLISDEDAIQWIDAATVEVIADHPVPFGGTDSTLAAFTALARLAGAATEDQAQHLLDLTASFLADRKPGLFKRSDQDHASLVIAIADRHPGLRRSAVEQMCRMLQLSSRWMTDTILDGRGWTALRSESDLVVELCAPASERGNPQAAIALVVVGATEQAKATARRQVRHFITPTEPAPTDLVSPQHAALLAGALEDQDLRLLGEAFRAAILDSKRLAIQRQESLDALTVLAAALNTEQRVGLYPTVLDAACGNLDGSTGDEDGQMHPYDRFGINWGTTTLRYAGLRAAAALATTPEQSEELLTLTLIQLPHADTGDALTLAEALAKLNPEHARLPVEVLAAHSLPWVRVLAARMWCTTQTAPAIIGATLARDPSHHVRRAMARCLTDTDQHVSLRLDLSHDPRRSVRCEARGKAAPTPYRSMGNTTRQE